MSTQKSSSGSGTPPASAQPPLIVARFLPGAVVRIRDNYPVDGGNATVLYSCKPYRGRLGRVVAYDEAVPEFVRVELVGKLRNMLDQTEWHFLEEELEEYKA